MSNRDKWSQLSMQQRADLIKLYVDAGITNIKNIRKEYNSYATGGDVDEGGWTKKSRDKRVERYKKNDPSGDYLTQIFYRLFGGGNQAEGEENEYWKAYLGLENVVPKMDPSAKTSWDDVIEARKIENGELPSDFYGTTPRMDLNIQAIADTLNTGKIVRNYSEYSKKHPDLPDEKTMQKIYETGKRVLNNPGKWQQIEGDSVGIKSKFDIVTNEKSPLGMLADFGMMWNPEDKTLRVHDTYDFPLAVRMFSGNRPKEMKIRGKINFDPKKGSKLLRNDLENFNNYPDAVKTNYYSTGGLIDGEYAKYPLDATTDNGEKYSDIIMQREHDAYNALLRNGYSIEDAKRLSPILTTQSLYETGWRLSDKDNNYAGYLDSKGNKLKYNSSEEFWDSHLKNLSNRWNNWDTAQNVEDYYNIVNQTHLNLKSKEDYNRYKKDNPNTFIYSPTWENANYKRRLLSTNARVLSYLDRLSMNKDFPLNIDTQSFIDKSLLPVGFLYK